MRQWRDGQKRDDKTESSETDRQSKRGGMRESEGERGSIRTVFLAAAGQQGDAFSMTSAFGHTSVEPVHK